MIKRGGPKSSPPDFHSVGSRHFCFIVRDPKLLSVLDYKLRTKLRKIHQNMTGGGIFPSEVVSPAFCPNTGNTVKDEPGFLHLPSIRIDTLPSDLGDFSPILKLLLEAHQTLDVSKTHTL